ncbi:MAG: lipoate--protein ligase [Vulcanibacillus sp.]
MSKTLKIKYIESSSFDPWLNLACEEYMLNNIKEDEIIFYLWQNEKTVVIGANQNPWKECDVNLLEKEEGKLARRMSGGGAVYHDLGNLNFTFIVDKNYYDFFKQVKVIIDALQGMGISADFSGRNDILVNNRKISGNAFYHSNKGSIHHGTILVNSDFNQLVKYLQVSKDKIKSKGIESVRSRVINLKEASQLINIEDLKKNLKNHFAINYGNYEHITYDELDSHEITELYNKYASWDWRFGDSPKFAVSITRRFELGELNINLNLDKGIIRDVKIYSDAMDPNIGENIKGFLIDVSLNEVSSKLEKKEIDNEVKEWIISELKNL